MQQIIAPGTLIGGRLSVERVAGSGGMGTVYRARDVRTGEAVAIKVLQRATTSAHESQRARRFAREVRILSEFHHPGIVAYVTSGKLPGGLPYLVMEWLQGEDLAQRLRRGPLTPMECLKLLERVGVALAYAHHLGIVHRDIKPSNLFLCDERFDRVVLLDFGVAHYDQAIARSALTLAGAVVGTLEYMAPEQARAQPDVGPPADIYSLGRVVYHSLVGRPRSPVGHVAAALARVMFEELPPLSEAHPNIPIAFSALVSRMLAKDPEHRPPDGAALLRELSELEPFDEVETTTVTVNRILEGQREQTLYSIVLAVPEVSTDHGVTSSDVIAADMALRRAIDGTLVRHGLRPIWLLDGSLLLAMAPAESAHDQAARAARCAMLIKSHWPAAAVALATGRGHMAGGGLIGEVVDRAAGLLRQRATLSQDSAQATAAGPDGVWVDGLSASLLERSFVLIAVPGGALLTGEPLPHDDARPVLGTLTPCIGREQELTILDAILSRCRSDSEAQAALITAHPGVGKTRLRQEFLLRLRRHSAPTTTLFGIGESMSWGAPYAILGQALRRLCGIAPSGDPALSRGQLMSYATELLGEKAAALVAPFLGELCSLPFTSESSAELRSARGDSRAMAAHLQHAFSEVLKALCARATVVLLLDDLHWGDALSVQLIDSVLRKLEGQPLMVLALARPEVRAHFPLVRKWPCVKEIPLDGLSRMASERLVRYVLGTAVAAGSVSRIVQHASGNALLLEELIRAEGEQHGEALPETVLAILQARMQRLALEARLLLGKASIYGQRFHRGGLVAILDAVEAKLDLDAMLEALAQAELIVAHKQSFFTGEAEYSFRHPLMREAAYGLLLDEQKLYWHRIAAEFLSRAGEPDAMVLAEHYSRSDLPVRGSPYFARGAELALDGNNLQMARSCIERGLSANPEGETRGDLLGLKATVLYRAFEQAEGLRTGEEALRLLPPGRVRWCRTFHAVFVASFYLGDKERMHELPRRFLAVAPKPEALAAYLETGGLLLILFAMAGQRQAGKTLLERMLSLGEGDRLSREPGARMWLRLGQCRFTRLLDGDPWSAWCLAEEAVAAATESGNRRWIGITLGEVALAELELGAPTGDARLRLALKTLHEIQEESAADFVSVTSAHAMSDRSEHAAEAEELVKTVLSRNHDNAYFAGIGHLTLSRIRAATGALADAETEARSALSALLPTPPMRCSAFAQLGRVLLLGGRLDAAGAVAEEGLAELRAQGEVGYQDLRLRLLVVETRRATGDLDGATSDLRAALASLNARAARIPDPLWRARYLENVVENARLRALGVELLD